MESLEQGRVIAGRYRLERPLAKGGMGSVWVARHLQLDVDVAVKFMSPQLAASAQARARFEREAKAAALLKMANAVSVSDYGVEGETPFMVMELLEGEDLQARLLRAGTLGPAEIRAVFEPVCKVLRRAHELGLVHRDLKPGNIFLARQGGEEVVKVLDFGIAKDTGAALGGSATQTGAMLGSPHYMSPEQVRSTNRVDHRTDLWALGVIAFQCLTGRLPFNGDEVGEVLVEVCTAPIPVPSALVPGLGPEVDRFFARALDRDPTRRFQSAAELYDALAAPAFAQASAPAFAQASAPALAQASAPALAQASAPAVATLSPSAHTAHIVPARGGRGVAIAAVVVGGALTLAGVAFVALRSVAPVSSTPAPASSSPPSAATPEPPVAAPVPVPSTSVSAGTDASAAAPSASPSASASARSTAPPKDARGRPSNRKSSGKSKNGDDPLDHM